MEISRPPVGGLGGFTGVTEFMRVKEGDSTSLMAEIVRHQPERWGGDNG